MPILKHSWACSEWKSCPRQVGYCTQKYWLLMILEKKYATFTNTSSDLFIKKDNKLLSSKYSEPGRFYQHNVSEKNCMIELAVGRTTSSDLSQVSWFCSFSNSMYSCYLTFCQSSGKVCQTKVLNVTCTDCCLPFTAWTFYEVLHGWLCFGLFLNVFHKGRILN